MNVSERVFVPGCGVLGGHWTLQKPESRKSPYVNDVASAHLIELQRTDVVADLGAHAATYGLCAARLGVAEVRCFEPTPFIAETILLNEQPGNLQMIEAAVVTHDSAPETIDLNLGAGVGCSNSVMVQKRGGEATAVKAVSYADAVRDASVVKIDVEGAEYTFPPLVPDGNDTLRGVAIEFHVFEPIDKERAAEICAWFRASGWTALREPTFKSHYQSHGVWVREPPRQLTETFAPVWSGSVCSCCGHSINGRKTRSLCEVCYPLCRRLFRARNWWFFPAKRV